MTDPGVEEMDAWANRHPRAARTLIVASIWAVLHGIALFLGWLGLGIFGGLFSGFANLLAIGWALVLVYLNWDRVAPALRRAREWIEVNVSRRTLREYRFASERSAHEEQARETTISLGLMAEAAPDDPTQTRMASDIEHGMEARLAVLLGKPQLSLAEKRERDAIQMALQARRAGFDATPAVAAAPRPMGFAGLPVPGFSWLRILPYALVGLSVAANGVLFASWRGAEREADQIEERARQAEARVENLTVALDQYSSAINQAQQNVRVSVDTLAEERARRVEAERRLRRDRDANRQVDVGGPAPDWLGLMQQHEPVAPGDSGNADPAPSADDPG